VWSETDFEMNTTLSWYWCSEGKCEKCHFILRSTIVVGLSSQMSKCFLKLNRMSCFPERFNTILSGSTPAPNAVLNPPSYMSLGNTMSFSFWISRLKYVMNFSVLELWNRLNHRLIPDLYISASNGFSLTSSPSFSIPISTHYVTNTRGVLAIFIVIWSRFRLPPSFEYTTDPFGFCQLPA
jgi:hypothetical protein